MRFSIEVFDVGSQQWVQLEPVYSSRKDRDDAEQRVLKQLRFQIGDRQIVAGHVRIKSWDENNPIYREDKE